VDDAGIEALFGIDFKAAGEPGSAPSDRIPERRTGRRAAVRPSGGRKNGKRHGVARRREIQAAMESLEALISDLAGLRRQLKDLLSGRSEVV
jgi:hypothetical protein